MVIHLIDIGKSYDDGRTWAVEKLTLEVPEGQLLVLLVIEA